jgi:drug/metabolite transporter (DMT)-like permease
MFIAEALAIGSAASAALGSLLVARLKGRVGLLRLTRWQLGVAFALTAAASAALGGWRSLDGRSVGLLAASSFFGVVIASSTYFASIYAIGPRLTQLLFSLSAPFALALGYLAFGETISWTQGGGVALTLLGVALALAPERGLSVSPEPRPTLIGVAFAVVTALGQALGGMFARPAMQAGVEPITAMAVRAGVACVALLIVALTPWARAERDEAGLREFGVAALAAFIGSALSMSLLMAALARGGVGLVSTLAATTPVLILPLVWIVERRAPSLAGWGGAALAVAGAALIGLG